ncbi:MAG: hypothetical protein QM589_17995 [Thermomicrobiales bacterium]
MGEIVAYLVDRYERERFWKQVRADYARLKADPVAWSDYIDEVEAWDTLSGDGLEREAPYYTAEEERDSCQSRRATSPWRVTSGMSVLVLG